MTGPVGPIIDFRLRPPYKSFLVGDLHDNPAGASETVFSRSGGRDESWRQGSIELLIQELAAAGVDQAVVTGRTSKRDKEYPTSWGTVSNDDVAELCTLHPGLFVGFGSVDVTAPKEAVPEIRRIKELGLRGVAFDNPLGSPPRFDDDRDLFVLYEECAELNLVISLASSVFLGPDLSYSDPVHVQRVARAFPEVPVVVPHASWPWVAQACAVALQNPNVYLVPDLYLHTPHMPASQDYVNAANLGLDDQLVFASSYPVMSIQGSVNGATAAPWEDENVRGKYLSGNAERILKWTQN